MVDQILLFSRMEAGHAAYDLQPLDVGEIVEQSIRTMSASINEATCRISRRIPENLPAVKADAGAITQCLQNLLSNAIKYGHNAGMAKIEVAAEANVEEHTVQIRVMDSGPGIDSSDLPQVFEPFFRGKNARSDIPGSGLGLNLVRRLMTGQGGRVTVESKTGEGTTFTLHLPEMMESSG
jgi:signal transduction histidine kinase